MQKVKKHKGGKYFFTALYVILLFVLIQYNFDIKKY